MTSIYAHLSWTNLYLFLLKEIVSPLMLLLITK
jgi:hypothetical protein